MFFIVVKAETLTNSMCCMYTFADSQFDLLTSAPVLSIGSSPEGLEECLEEKI